MDLLIRTGPAWAIHTADVSVWVLLSLALLVQALRVGLVMAAGPEQPRPRTRALWLIFILGALAAVAGYLAVRPNQRFYRGMGFEFMNRGEYRRAIDYFGTAARWGTNHIDVYHNLGVCYLQLNEYRLAARAFEQAQTLPPNDFTVFSHIYSAFAYTQLGEPGPALEHLRRAAPRVKTQKAAEEYEAQRDEIARRYPAPVGVR